MVYDDIQRLYISVHDAMSMWILQCLKDHVCVQSNIHAVEAARQDFCFYIRNVFKDQRWRFACRFTKNVKEFNYVGSTVQRLKYFDLTILLLDSDGLQNLDYTLLLIAKISSFENLWVLAAAQLMVDVVIVEDLPREVQALVVWVAIRTVSANEFIRALEDLVHGLLRLLGSASLCWFCFNHDNNI